MSREFQSPDATEKAAVEAALKKCRALAAQIKGELRNKEQLVDKASLAELFAALERAADVLRPKGDRRFTSPAGEATDDCG